MSEAKSSSIVNKTQEVKNKRTKKIAELSVEQPVVDIDEGSSDAQPKEVKRKRTKKIDTVLAKQENNKEQKAKSKGLKKTKRAIAIIENKQSAIETDDYGTNYLARSVIQATLPHSDPKSDIYTRKDGNFTLMIRGNPKYGLPYGVIPRLLLAWITTEAVRTKSKDIVLGDSLAKFLEQIGLGRTGGKNGTITRLKDQLRRLLSCTISFSYSDKFRTFVDNTTPIRHAEIWWLPMNEQDEENYNNSKHKLTPSSKTLFESILVLSEDFFQDITRNPIPVRIETLVALKGSAMDLDIYFWLTMQNGRQGATERLIPYELLQEQFGGGYPKDKRGKYNFRKSLFESIKRVALVYPAANLLKDEGKKGLLYVPGEPDIQHKS